MVFTAIDPDGRRVAVKVGREASGVGLQKFLREADVMRSLAAHPSVLSLLAQGTLHTSRMGIDAGAPWLASPYHPGGTLTPWCRRVDVTWPRVGAVLRQVLCALTHVHARGWLHLDLKPANVFLSDPSGHPRAVLGDLGIARRRDVRPTPNTTTGTPAYMAPERFRGDWERTGPPTDLYSLGAVGWRLVTGSRPLQAATLDEWRSVHETSLPGRFSPRFAIPEGLETWLRRLLAKDSGERFVDAPAALLALDGLGGVRWVPVRAVLEGREAMEEPLSATMVAA